MIRIWPNKLEGEPCETHQTERRMTIAQWFDSICKGGFKAGDPMPVSVKVEGEIIDRAQWESFVFKPADDVRIFLEPKGTDPFSITVALFSAVKAVFGLLMPALPGTPSAPGSGKSLTEGSAGGNKVKFGDPIRESFGFCKIYPDYALPPHKVFTDPRTQWLELFLVVGKGRYQVNADNVRIGETSLLSLGDEAEYEFFGPGELVTRTPCSTWWHSAPEVGSSSTGAAGLELTASTSITPTPNSSTFVFSGYTITIPAGAGNFPADWTVGLILRVVAPYTYTVTDGGGTNRDLISGPLGMLAPVPGDTIEVVGTNAGTYTVFSYSGGNLTLNTAWGAPANALTLGTGQAAIGPLGLRFRITAFSTSSITLERLDESGSTDPSFPGFDLATILNASISVDASSLEGGWRGPFPACPEGEKTEIIEWDTFFPQGFCGVGQEGQVYETAVTYELQYRDMAVGGAYYSVVQSEAGQTLDQVGISRSLTLAYPMRPEVRLRLVAPLGENLELHNTIQWYGLRSRLQGPVVYPGVTTLAVRVKVSDRIAAQTEALVSVYATRILPTRAGGEWQPPSPTRDIIPVIGYIAKETLGYTDDDLDLVEMDRLDALWKARGDQFNYSVDTETTAKQILNDALGAGFAELTLDRGRIRPVRDEPRTVFEHMYTPQNMIQGLTRDIQLFNPDDFDGVDVTYWDERTWTQETLECRLYGDVGRKVEKVDLKGVTDKTLAWRQGMRRRRIQKFRRDTYEWGTEMDALNSRYLSYCAVADDVPGYGQSALLLGFTAGNGIVLLESSEPLDWSAGGTFMAALRRPDGTLSGPYVATRIDDYRLTIPSVDFEPDVTWEIEPPHLLFGPVARWSYPVLISEVSPQGTTSATVRAIGYSAEVYADDDNGPP